MIVVPAEIVLLMVEECGRKGVKGVIVISAGFAESGVDGAKRQENLIIICRHYGMKLIGPNCMGVMNTDPSINLNATFSHVFPPQGNIAMATDSGALGLVILEHASNLGIGLSNFASVGNRADVSSNDLLHALSRSFRQSKKIHPSSPVDLTTQTYNRFEIGSLISRLPGCCLSYRRFGCG